MVQVAQQCRVFDADLEKAAAQIQKNQVKSICGLQKYVQELIKSWANR